MIVKTDLYCVVTIRGSIKCEIYIQGVMKTNQWCLKNNNWKKRFYDTVNAISALIVLFGMALVASVVYGGTGSTLPSGSQDNGSGTIYGEIRDASTSEVLPGASVVVKGLIVGTATDAQGRYTLRRVPAGEIVLVFSYLGYQSLELEITLQEGQRLEVNAELEGSFIEGSEIYVIAQQRGQSRALTIQRQSLNIRSVVSSEQINQFADGTVSDALQRIAGMGHGGANIRGVGAGSANITMDGQRMGSTGDDRSVDVSTISADMLDQLEVIKVITPDMDADALSGTINISTRRPIGGQRTMNARLGGGWNSRFVDQIGPSRRVTFSIGDSPSERFSYGLNLSYLHSNDASEHVRTDWDWSNFRQIDGPSDILTDLRYGFTYDPRDRYSVGTQFTLQPSTRTTFFVMTNANYTRRKRELHEMQWKFRDFFSPTETRGIDNPGRAGDMIYLTNLDISDIWQLTARVGARHLFDRFELDYNFGWGHGRTSVDKFRPEYSTLKAFEHRFNFDRGNDYPTLEILGTSLIRQFPEKSDFFNRFSEEVSWDFHRSNEFTGSLDLNIPLTRGSLKFGSSGLMIISDGMSERFMLQYQRQLFLNNYDSYLGREFRVFNRQHWTYHMPFIIDVHRMREFNKTYRPQYDMDIQAWALTAGTSYYNANEYTAAAYGMGTLELGRLRILGGLRIEHTSSKYNGRAGTIDEDERFRGAVDTVATNSYTHLFPNAQFIFSLGKMTNIRLAYSRSIGRPTLSQLSPNVLWNYSNERITEGNPRLNPMLSNNLDLLFEHYFMNVGQFSVGVFYKFMRDFIYDFTELISPDGVDGEGTFARWRRTTLLNGEEANVYGIEVSWQQHLNFLPGFLGNFDIYSNYSYAMSEADIDRPGQKVRLQDQRMHVVNAGIGYTQGRFNTHVSYAWGSPSITSYGDLDFAPTLYGDEKRVYMDEYRDAANNLSMTARYRLTDAFHIWGEANNILNFKQVDYVYNREVYPRTQFLAGRTVNLGLRYTF